MKTELSEDSWHYCGYVQTGLRFGYTDLPYNGGRSLIEVHGGVTYGVDSEGWIGFDCAHAGDTCVEDGSEHGEDDSLRKVWTVDKVKSETEKLADQLKNLEEFVAAVDKERKTGDARSE